MKHEAPQHTNAPHDTLCSVARLRRPHPGRGHVHATPRKGKSGLGQEGETAADQGFLGRGYKNVLESARGSAGMTLDANTTEPDALKWLIFTSIKRLKK